MCSPQHSATAVDAQSPQPVTHTHDAYNLSLIMCDTLARCLRGCAVDVSRGDGTERE